MNVWSLSRRAATFRSKDYALATFFFLLFFMIPVIDGLLLGRAFDALTSGDTGSVYRIGAILLVTESLHMAAIYMAVIYFVRAFWLIDSMFRSNMLAAQIASGGDDAGPLTLSAGEAITHFRDDPEDVTPFLDSWIDNAAAVVFTVAALAVLGGVNPRATVALGIPMLAVFIVTFALDRKIKYYRAADRQATVAVTGALGDVFGASTSITVNGAAEATLAHLRRLFDVRRSTAVRDRVLEDGLLAFARGSSEYSLAITIIVAAGAIASGAFDTGDFALFVVFLTYLGFLPRMIGRMMARRKQAGVALEGMATLVANEDKLLEHRFLPFEDPEEFPERRLPERSKLTSLVVRDLAVDFDGSGGVAPISFEIQPGTLTVVTGVVGSGKSVLLRALLGLVDERFVSGEVLWNGQFISDKAAFFVPPQAAYLPQVPNLISDSLAANILLGVGSDEDFNRALGVVSLQFDLEQMPEGRDTLVGPRGMRLSGGQRQRVAAARAFVHQPELVVLDDLSSALDVETELELWSNLAVAGATVLAVSHRQVAFDRADRVINLSDNHR